MQRILRSHARMIAVAFVLGAGLLAVHYLIGTPRGASFDYNLSWYEAFRSAFWQGDLYPRFAPELWYGNGGLDFLFYGPLPFWFATLIGEVSCPGCSTSQAFSISGAWMLILSGITFFIFARRFFTPAWAGFGAILYVLLPFHYLVNWYIGQTIGAMLALAILPLLALAACQLIEDRKGGFLFSLSLAALALSHLPSTLIVLHLLVLMIGWAALTRERSWPDRLKFVLRFAPWGLLGIALSAFYWLPAIALLGDVSSDKLYTSYYDSTKWLYLDGQPENDPAKTLKFKFILLSAVVLALCAAYLHRRNERNSSLILWIVGPSAFAAFLMTIVSYPIWKFWILNRVQFPDRALVVTDISIALSAIIIARAIFAPRAEALAKRGRTLATIAAGALMLAFVSPVIQFATLIAKTTEQSDTFHPVAPPEYVPPAFLELAFDRYRDRDTSHLSNADSYYVFFDEMKSGFDAAHQALQSDAPGATLTAKINDRIILNVDLAATTSVRVPIPGWIYWHARTADGAAVPLETDAELGVLRAILPTGPSEIEFHLVETLPQKAGSSISVLALLCLLIIAGYRRFLSRNAATSL